MPIECAGEPFVQELAKRDFGQWSDMGVRQMGEGKGQAGLETKGGQNPREMFVSRVDSSASSLERPQESQLPLWQRCIRALMHLWFFVSRGMTLGVRAIVLNPEGQIFLVRHTYIRGWHLPGGGIEWGQSALSALARELEEEGNLQAEAEPELLGMFWNRHASRRDHVLVFGIRTARQSKPKQPDREIAEARFFAPDALPEGTTDGTRQRIAEWLQGAPRSEVW
jgi:ADP-ribose pyrophosphatase YjhB (NUDIX family)